MKISISKSIVDGYEPQVATERERILKAAMADLPNDLGQLLTTRYYEDVKPKEIAATNGTTAQNVRNATRRGLRQLRKTLKENGIDNPGSI